MSCPHTYNDVDTFDDFSLAGHRGEQNQFGGRTWYRKTFVIPESWNGKKVYIEFEAARQVAEVYLNGERLGVSKTGFIPFGFDLTSKLKFGQANVIAVMCDNRFMKDPPEKEAGGRAPPLPTAGVAAESWQSFRRRSMSRFPKNLDELRADQIPWNNPHWHPAHGGLYRNVYLHVVDPLHVSLPLYSFLKTAGPYVYSTEVSEKSATINLELPIENGRTTEETVQVVAEILDRDGNSVATLEPVAKTLAATTIAPGRVRRSSITRRFADPQLWEPDVSVSVSPRLHRPRGWQGCRSGRDSAWNSLRQIRRDDRILDQRASPETARLGTKTDR